MSYFNQAIINFDRLIGIWCTDTKAIPIKSFVSHHCTNLIFQKLEHISEW